MGKIENKINYKLPSGFDVELLPEEKRLELHIIDTIRNVFEQYGFTPIETPAVERLEVLQAKGNQGDNIIYSINPIIQAGIESNSEQATTESRGLKFDQTVPLSAYIARHLNDLAFPFARYQMDTVFRGERAKKGRYRQFRQCDIDVVGRGKLSLLYDAQMPAIIAQIFESIQIGKFLIRISNRKILTGFFRAIGVAEDEIRSCIKIIDILEKVGEDRIKADLREKGISGDRIREIIDFVKINDTNDNILEKLDSISSCMENSREFSIGVSELTEVIKSVRALGVSEDKFCIDLSIARGLEYYTGTVYETALIGYETLGSICSGGRYEELVGTFVGEKMPGVGISIGLTRLIRQLLDAKILKPMAASPAQVMIVNLQSDLIDVYLKVSQRLRKSGINVLTSFETRSLGKQLQYADKLGILLCVIIGSDENATGMCSIKTLGTGEQASVLLDDLIEEVMKRLE